MSYSSVILADNPTAYWRLQEASGITAVDSSPNGNNATYPAGGIAYQQPGPYSGEYAIDFNGTSTQYITTPIQGSALTAFSIELWAKITAVGSEIFSAQSHSGGAGYGVQVGNGGNPYWFVDDGTATYNQPTPLAYNDSLWHHFIFTFSMTNNRAAIYVDGVQVRQDTSVGIGAVTPSAPLEIGPFYTYDPGYAADFAYYPTELTASQAQTHYNAAATPTPVDLASTMTVTSLSTSSLQVSRDLASTSTIATSTQAAIQVQRDLASTDMLVSSSTADLQVSRDLASSATVDTSSSADLQVTRNLASVVDVTVQMIADLLTVSGLSSVMTVSTDSTATITVERSLASDMTVDTTTIASLLRQALLASDMTVSVTSVAVLQTGKSLVTAIVLHGEWQTLQSLQGAFQVRQNMKGEL